MVATSGCFASQKTFPLRKYKKWDRHGTCHSKAVSQGIQANSFALVVPLPSFAQRMAVPLWYNIPYTNRVWGTLNYIRNVY